MNRTITYTINALFGAGMALLGVFFLSNTEIVANDDVYVYFNYARNLVEGRPFAYDHRGIPSEGFTSLLYVLILAPFEYLKVNLMFAGFMINTLALAATVYAAALLARASGLAKDKSLPFFLLVFSAALVFDSNIRGMVGWAFETLLNPLFMLACFLFFEKTLALDGNKERRWLSLFFVSYFAAFLVRPENLAIIGTLVLLLFIMHRNRKLLIRYTIAFSVFLGLFLLFKYIYFHDIFPTGFYRKVSLEALPGKDHVLSGLKAYSFQSTALLVLFSAFIVHNILKRLKHAGTEDSSASSMPLEVLKHILHSYRLELAMVLVALVNALFYLKVEPLVGVHFRFLVIPIVIVYFLLALFIVRLTERGILAKLPPALFMVITLAAICVTVFVSKGSIKGIKRLTNINIYHRVLEQTASHHYLRFGSYMRESLSRPEDVTMVMGDAGAVPYSFHCRFIDPNGLTEPYIARLFGNVPDKTRLFVDYIKQQEPDIFLIWFTRPNKFGQLRLFKNNHSPLNTDEWFEALSEFQRYGIKYVGSLVAYYDLHIGIRESSEHFGELKDVLSRYLSVNGYFLRNGLFINHKGKSVHFERIKP
jgi:hypothetical protein